MKTKHPYCLILSFAILYLSSCQKESSVERGVVVPVVNNLVGDSNYLDKIIYTSTVGNIIDTVFTQIYQYDASKRVVSLIDSTKSTSSISENQTIKYFYNGNDTLPFKKVETFCNLNTMQATSNKDTSISFYQYSITGTKIKDSILNFSHHLNVNGSGNDYVNFYKEIINYEYSQNMIYGKSIKTITYSNTNPNLGSSKIYDTAMIDFLGNIIINKKYDDSNVLFLTSNFTYDTKPNPFARLSNYKTITVFPSGETFIDQMQAKNNRLKAVEIGNGLGSNNDLTGKYQYNLNGYPKQIIETDPMVIYKITFIYRSL